MTPNITQPDSIAMLAGATLFAMTRFAESPCAERASMVVRHLECVAGDPGGDESLREVCNALARRWRRATLNPEAGKHVGAAR